MEREKKRNKNIITCLTRLNIIVIISSDTNAISSYYDIIHKLYLSYSNLTIANHHVQLRTCQEYILQQSENSMIQ